ncbi:MAG: hypothetical protein IKN91_08730 [Paludibacteraceae bacterium]|nr:hypothetical protein [Paludibacteraceae bacterium]
MKKTVLIIVLSIIALMSYAQVSDFDKFVQQQNDHYNQFVHDNQAEFDAFRKKVNEDYANFMRKAWQAMDAQPADIPVDEKTQPPVIYERPIPEEDTVPAPQPQPLSDTKPQTTPKPDSTPVPDMKPQPDTKPLPTPSPKPIPVKPEVVVVPKPKPAPKPIAPINEESMSQHTNVSISFYGTPISMAFPKNDKLKVSKLAENELADAWQMLSTKQYDNTVKTALDTRKRLSLCDWAYMEMLKQITQKQYGMTNEAVLAQAFLMTQSGYRVRLGRTESKLYLLVASDYTIYRTSYFILDGIKFYVVGDDAAKSMYICPSKYEKEESLCLQMSVLPSFSDNPTPKRKLTSRKGVTASVSVNSNLLDFMGNYPSASVNNDFTTRWAAYANTPLDNNIKDALYPVLRNVVRNMSELDAVNILLNWVQTAFEYGYDDRIWGRDRAFFAQETLYYPYSDCEDRAILFSCLVRDIMGLDVVLLYYPGHLATAVAFSKPVSGDYLTYKNRKYIVCDPTYINAPVGKTMPKMDNRQATIIVLK